MKKMSICVFIAACVLMAGNESATAQQKSAVPGYYTEESNFRQGLPYPPQTGLI